MSVLAAVAFLNGDESQPQQPSSPKPVDQPTTTTTTTTPTPTPAPVPAPRKIDNNEKPTTAAAIQELNRIRTGGGAGVASLMSKFGQDAPPPKRSISPNKQPQPISKAAPTPPRTPSPTSSNQSSTFEKAASSSLSSRGTPAPASALEYRSTKTTAQTKISNSRVNTRTNIDMMIEELTIMYQQSLDECKEAQQQLQQLKSEAETYETDSTKVRDYEIRVEYLAQKLEQVSDERDALEQELAGYRANRSNIETPVSPVFQHRLSDIFDKRSSADQNEDPHENDESNSEFMHGLLDAYEEEDEEQEENEEQQEEQSMSPQEHIKYLQEQLKASDVGTKMAVQQYLAELEKERTETKALRDVVRKQDELIATLESKIINNNNTPSTTPVVSRPPRKASLASPTYKSSSNNAASAAPPLPNQSNVERQLREQLESQRLELEDKRALLTQLLNEREDILKKAKMSGNGGRPGASSFDLLAELARPLDNNNGRNTPPPTAPPRDPLPPVPNNATSPSSGRESMPSMRDDASSVTSWSAASASASAAAAAVDKHNDSVNDFEAMYANYLDSSEDANEHHLLALRRLEGPEQRSQPTH